MANATLDRPGESSPDDGDRRFHSHVELLAALGKSLHASGLPSHRLEGLIVETATHLGTPARIFSLPTGLLVSVGKETLPITMLFRGISGAVHLERLAKLWEVARGIARDALEPTEAKRRIDAVMAVPLRWRPPAIVLAYVLSAGAFSVFFGGGAAEIGTGIAVGLAAGLIAIAMQHYRATTRLFELLAAAAAASIANTACTFMPEMVEWIPLAAGLVILLPGFSMVDALDELAHGHLASGGSRMAGVGVVLLALTFGGIVGAVVLSPTTHFPPVDVPRESPAWWALPALFVVALGSMIRFRAEWRDYKAALIGSIVAFAGARLGSEHLGHLAGPFVAALMLGAAANTYANITHRPAQLMVVPGLALLVPGSFGVRSMAALLTDNIELGVDTAFHMSLTAMALVAGLLFSNTFYRAKLAR